MLGKSFTIVLQSQSKYPVLHKVPFGSKGFLFLGRVVSQASTEKKGLGRLRATFKVGLFMFSGAKKNVKSF